jgi:hypothetical protein
MKHYEQIDAQRIPIKGFVPEAGSAPSSPVDGQIYYDTTAKKLYEYNSTATAWQELIRSTDSRLTDSRTPSGTITGDLAGSTWPALNLAAGSVSGGPGGDIADGTITIDDIATALQGPAAGVFGLRKLIGGTGAQTMALASDTRLNELAPANGQVSINSQLLTNVANGVAATDGVNKGQLDAIAQGLDAKASVRVATTANITLSGLQTIDAVVTTVAGDRVLVKDQTADANNGIYIAASGAWTRATDMDSWAEVPSAYTFVEEGTSNAGSGWVCVSKVGGTLGTTTILWQKFTSAASISAGNGLVGTTTFDVNPDNSTIEVVADQVRVKDAGITAVKLASNSVVLTASAVTGILPTANGGLGVNPNTAANRLTARNSINAMGRYSTTVPALTANVWSTNINHALGAANNVVSFYEASTGEGCELDWKTIDGDNIQVRSAIAVSGGTLIVVVGAA